MVKRGVPIGWPLLVAYRDDVASAPRGKRGAQTALSLEHRWVAIADGGK